METEQSLNADIRQHLTGLQSALAHMKEMVEGISLYFKADKLELQPKNISTEKEIPRIFNQLRYYYPDHLKRYSLKIQPSLPDCCADPLLFRQAMTNLLSNVVKATQAAPSPLIRVYGQRVEGTAVLTIEDNGIDLPPENRNRSFRLFKSAHARSQFPGSGVVLSIVQRIVERHGGSIEVHSEGEGTGARFIIALPGEKHLPTAD